MRRSTATTEYLKECMGNALLELMKQKPIEKISIEEMTAKADVGRSTYFRYFKTKDEVLAFKVLCLWKRFAEENHITDFQADFQDSARLFFEFCLSTRAINDQLYTAGHQNVLLAAYLKVLIPETPEKDLYMYYRSNGIAYAVFGMVNAWILHGYQETPERMSEILFSVFK